jgi:hypothetical protein
LVVVVAVANVVGIVFFWLWEKWTPRDCWHQTQEKCCVNIHNYSGSKVLYTKANKTSPAVSFKSLTDVENVIMKQPDQSRTEELALEELNEPIVIRTRSNKMFR